jgi:hypothetical protein
MALSATLTADFTSFIDAAKDAGTALKEFQGTATTTGRVLDTALDGVDSGPAVAETKQLTAAFNEMGTTAAQTAPALTTVEDATAGATGQTTMFKDSLGTADKALKAVGINLGPLGGALDQFTAAAGKSVTELGLLGTAGLVAAAGMAGWQIGKKIDEWTGLSTWIGNATSAAMGWGDVAAAEAAAGADTLARASAVAGREITTMAEAIRILNDAATATKEDLKLSSEAAEKFAADVSKLFGYDDINRAEQYRAALGGVQNVTKLTTDAKKELHAAVTDALDAYKALGQQAPPELLAIQRATTELITVTKSFSAANSGMWTQFAASAEEGSARIAAVLESAKLTWEDIWTEMGGHSRAELESIARDAEEKFAVASQHSERFTTTQIADFERAAVAARAAVDSWGTVTLDTYDTIAAASAATANAQIADATRVSTSWHEAMSAVASGQGTMGGTVGGAPDQSAGARAAIQKAWEEGRYYGPVVNVSEANPRGTGPDFQALGYRAAGGPVQAGNPYMVGERGPELFVPSTAGTIQPHGAGGLTVNNTIQITGGTETLARQVADEIMRTIRAGTQLGTA